MEFRTKLVVVVVFVLLFSCKKEKQSIENRDSVKYKIIHSLIDSDRKKIGEIVIGEMVNDTIFKKLYVVNETDTIYRINKNSFINTEGIDFEITSKNFYGFYMVHKGSDYFVVGGTFNEGKSISDDLTIEWDYQKELLSLLKLP